MDYKHYQLSIPTSHFNKYNDLVHIAQSTTIIWHTFEVEDFACARRRNNDIFISKYSKDGYGRWTLYVQVWRYELNGSMRMWIGPVSSIPSPMDSEWALASTLESSHHEFIRMSSENCYILVSRVLKPIIYIFKPSDWKKTYSYYTCWYFI